MTHSAAVGGNILDLSVRRGAARAGREQGRHIAARDVAALWVDPRPERAARNPQSQRDRGELTCSANGATASSGTDRAIR
jgi:hypothetical protein